MIVFHMTDSELRPFSEIGVKGSSMMMHYSDGWNTPYIWAIDGNELMFFERDEGTVTRWDIPNMLWTPRKQEYQCLAGCHSWQDFQKVYPEADFAFDLAREPKGLAVYSGQLGANRLALLKVILNTKVPGDQVIPGLLSLGCFNIQSRWKFTRNFITNGLLVQNNGEASTLEAFIRECLDMNAGNA